MCVLRTDLKGRNAANGRPQVAPTHTHTKSALRVSDTDTDR